MVTKYDFFDGECNTEEGHGAYVKDEEYEALKAERDAQQKRADALAVENAAINDRVQKLIQIISNADNYYCMCGDAMKNHIHGGCGHPTGMFDYHYNQWLESDNETPAISAALAEIKAQGLDELANACDGYAENHVYTFTKRHAEEFAANLREAK